jgi:hypothetical protein
MRKILLSLLILFACSENPVNNQPKTFALDHSVAILSSDVDTCSTSVSIYAGKTFLWEYPAGYYDTAKIESFYKDDYSVYGIYDSTRYFKPIERDTLGRILKYSIISKVHFNTNDSLRYAINSYDSLGSKTLCAEYVFVANIPNAQFRMDIENFYKAQ